MIIDFFTQPKIAYYSIYILQLSWYIFFLPLIATSWIRNWRLFQTGSAAPESAGFIESWIKFWCAPYKVLSAYEQKLSNHSTLFTFYLEQNYTIADVSKNTLVHMFVLPFLRSFLLEAFNWKLLKHLTHIILNSLTHGVQPHISKWFARG